jgi:hypothetical protein
MSGISDTILQPIYSGGIVVGAQVNGYVYIPFSNNAGIVMQDANGVNWLLQMGTDGRLQGGVKVVF